MRKEMRCLKVLLSLSAILHQFTHTQTHTHNSTLADELPSVTYLNQITYPKAHFYSVPTDFPAENHSLKIFCSKKINGCLGPGVWGWK